MNARESLAKFALAHGWEIEREPNLLTCVRRVPMVDQRDEYRLVIEFGATRIQRARFGPDRRPHWLTGRQAAIHAHLRQFGRPR